MSRLYTRPETCQVSCTRHVRLSEYMPGPGDVPLSKVHGASGEDLDLGEDLDADLDEDEDLDLDEDPDEDFNLDEELRRR